MIAFDRMPDILWLIIGASTRFTTDPPFDLNEMMDTEADSLDLLADPHDME